MSTDAPDDWDRTGNDLYPVFMPRHDDDCPVVASLNLAPACTCGVVSRYQDAVSAAYVRGWRTGYGAGRDDEAVGADLRDRP